MSEFAARASARWRAIDSLLPDPDPAGEQAAGCGAELVVGSGGNLAAFGTCRHSEPDPGETGLSWGMARRFELAPQVLGPHAGTALDRLITLWRDHLATVAGSDDDDTAAIVTWPSRDIAGAAALQRHGLQSLAVVAIRPAARAATGPASAAAGGGLPRGKHAKGVLVRRGGPQDAAAVAAFGAEVARFDAHFSGTPRRPGTSAALPQEAIRLLTPAAWTWLAERRGRPVGVIATQRPGHAAWIAPLTRLAPVAYTVLGYVTPDERSAGVGAALAARLHAQADLAGVAATLLHYEQLNPYAAPFWSRQGYRPLWTVWEARPARTLR